MRKALDREAGPAPEVASPAAAHAQEAERAAAAERRAREQAEADRAEAARRQAVADAPLAGDGVIWCDAAENTVRRVMNGYGRVRKYDNGGYRVGLKSGACEQRHYNTRCPDQFSGECFAVLKAIELAAARGLSACTIRNDRIGGFEASTKRGYVGAKYLWVAKKIAAEAGLTVTFDRCSGTENLADRVSRQEGGC